MTGSTTHRQHPSVLRPARGTLGAGLLGGLAMASGVALTATSGWLIVQASARPMILTLLTAIVAVRAFGIARPLLRYAERVRSHDAALADLARRRVATYGALVPLTPARLGRRARSALLTGVVQDLDDEVDAQVRVVVPVLSAAFAAVVAVALTTFLAPWVGVVLAAQVLAIGLLCAACWLLERSSQRDWLAARAQVAQVSALVTAQAGELQAVHGQRQALSWVRDAHEVLLAAGARQARGRALGMALLPWLTAAAVASAAVVAAGTAGLHPAVVALLVLTPLAVGDVLADLPDAMAALARSQAGSARLQGLLDQPAAVREPAGPVQPAVALDAGGVDALPVHAPRLDLSGLSASWGGEALAEGGPDVGPLDLTIRPGERLVVTGPSGCGKSTLLAVLARHLDPTSGTYRVDGVDVRTLPSAATRDLCAVMTDEPHVFATTLRENLRLAGGVVSGEGDLPDDVLVAALVRAGLGGWLAGLPRGLDTALGSGARGLSGGELARLDLARALLSGRPVLLLDEPVAHLDSATAAAVLQDVLGAADGRTVVLVSHRWDVAPGVDRVLRMALPGEVREEPGSAPTPGWTRSGRG